MVNTDEYKEMFNSECREHLQLLNEYVLKLEKDPADLEALKALFRSAHTIKGMAATMGYENMTNLTHTMETALDFYRKTENSVDRDAVQLTFECLDLLEKLADEVMDNNVGQTPVTESLKKLKAIIERNGPVPSKDQIEKMKRERAAKGKGAVATAVATPASASATVKKEEKRPASTPPAKGNEEEEKDEKDDGSPEGGPTSAYDLKKEAQEKALKSMPTIRVNVSNLESLLNLVGELVINKSRLIQIGRKYQLDDLNDALSQIHRLTTDLQDEVLKMRMVPTAYIFNRFPRMVRDLAKAEGKDVEFLMSGMDIELDRTVLDEISEPLVHLLRNSIDHGVETPEERTSIGKQPKGMLRLTAIREKSHVVIEVEDDGKGMDPKVLREKAVEKGIIDRKRASEMSDQEAIGLIFVAGFTTAKVVTDISGRGVGMDVVRTKIESLGGVIDIESTKGKGTITRLTLPLTMAIIQALLVEVGGETYAVPISTIVETQRLTRSDIKKVHGKEVMMLRDEIVPLIDLRFTLKLTPATEAEKDRRSVVIVEKGQRRLGLVADHLIGKQEVVVKPLGRLVQGIRGLGGATILGDGRVALILDVTSLV